MIWGVVAIAALVILCLFFWLVLNRKDPTLGLLQQQISLLNEKISHALGEVTSTTGTEIGRLHQTIGERLDQNSKIFSQVGERLARLEETQKQIQTVGEEISRLHDILRAPKLRGNLGELFLEELLSQILPPTYYEMQHTFRSGDRVDAVVRLPQNLMVPIDAKFPLENFQRMIDADATSPERESYRKTFVQDFKKHVDQIAAKYILPDEGTLDFALLYVPAENVYYESILRDPSFGEDKGINSYALAKRVIPVSPNSLYAYLQAIVLGLRGLQVESQAKTIVSLLARLKNEFQLLQDDIDLVGKHLNHALSAHAKSEKRVERLGTRMEGVTDALPETADPTHEPEISLIKNKSY